MAIPFNMLRRVKIPMKKRVALGAVFSLAVIITIFSIIRVTVVSALTRQPDQTWLYMWSAIEHSVGKSYLCYVQTRDSGWRLIQYQAIIISCLASFPSLFRNSARSEPEQAVRAKGSFIASSRERLRRMTGHTGRPSEASVILAEIDEETINLPAPKKVARPEQYTRLSGSTSHESDLERTVLPQSTLH